MPNQKGLLGFDQKVGGQHLGNVGGGLPSAVESVQAWWQPLLGGGGATLLCKWALAPTPHLEFNI